MVDAPPCGGRQRREHQCPVGLRLRAGNGHGRVHRRRGVGGGPGIHVLHHCLPGRPWRYVWTICGDDRSGGAGREDQGDRRGARGRVDGPNYNVAPTTTIATVVRRHDEPDDEPTRRVRSMRWGLIPPWVKAGSDGAPESKGPLLINARADKVTTSPAFRASAKSKRCLVPMDGYYEWRVNPDTDAGKKSRKTPFFMYRGDGETLFMAGLWSVWKPAKDADAAAELHHHHHRRRRRAGRDPRPDAVDAARARLGPLAESRRPARSRLPGRPPSVDGIEMREISTLVNSVRNNGPELLEPAEPEPEQATLL